MAGNFGKGEARVKQGWHCLGDRPMQKSYLDADCSNRSLQPTAVTNCCNRLQSQRDPSLFQVMAGCASPGARLQACFYRCVSTVFQPCFNQLCFNIEAWQEAWHRIEAWHRHPPSRYTQSSPVLRWSGSTVSYTRAGDRVDITLLVCG